MLRVLTSYAVFLLVGTLAATPLFLALPAVQAQDLTEEELAQERALEAELERVLAEIEEQKSYLESQRSQSASIERDIGILEAEIREAELKLEANQLRIQELTGNISATTETLDVLEANIDNQKTSLGELIRDMRELGDYSVVEMLLANDNLSDFFRRSDALLAVRSQVSSKLAEIQESQRLAQEKKASLEALKGQEMDVRYAISSEKEKVEVTQNQHAELLAVSRSKEKTYEEIVKEREAQAAAIRSALIRFRGSGVNNRSISFGEAYDYAKSASAQTGVRPAFILAVMQQETGFGRNVGGCYVTNGDTGGGVYIASGAASVRNMVPGNFNNFVSITSALGRDWQSTPISCALVESDGSVYGYGGAMGYTQFIPNTWMGVESRIRSYLGASVADPWNPEHAVWATSIFMRDLGAAARTYSAEYSAACNYYGSCSRYDYGTSVMNKAANIQRQIDTLESL